MNEQELKKLRGIIFTWQNEDTRVGGQSVPDLANRISDFIAEAGYVRLAEDQSLPPEPIIFIVRNGVCGIRKGQQEMLKAGWRKVEIGGENERTGIEREDSQLCA